MIARIAEGLHSSDSPDAVYTIRAAVEPQNAQSSYHQTKGGATVFIPQRPTVGPRNEWKETTVSILTCL